MSSIVAKPEDYFRKLVPPRDDFMIKLEAEAERENIPIVGPVVGELLYILAAATKVKRILETLFSTPTLQPVMEYSLFWDQAVTERALSSTALPDLSNRTEGASLSAGKSFTIVKPVSR